MIIPGILILSGNKTYGRARNSKGVQTKLLYKVIPHYSVTNQTACLIPYEIKHLGFSKALENLFVTFNSTTNTLDQVIGPVSSPQSFYEYQLYVYGLKNSINSLRKKITTQLDENSINTIASTYGLVDNTINHTNYIFSIDPETSVDFDDALSIKKIDDNYLVSIYIANVPIWLDWLGISLDQIPNCSTIYLPQGSPKYPMLPSILSDDLCSLWAGKPRAAFVLDLLISSSDYSIISKTWSNQLIKVNKNWSYSDPKLISNPNYQMLQELTCKCVKVGKTSGLDDLDSHKIVEYWMCQMNLAVGKELDACGLGIFRQAEMVDIITPPLTCPEPIAQTLQLIYSASSSYIKKEPDSTPISHQILNVESYLHVTSPIRRLVDIVNMGLIQQNICKIVFTNLKFNIACTNELVEKINTQSKNIRRVQNKCNGLYAITSRSEQDEVLEGWVCLSQRDSNKEQAVCQSQSECNQVYIPKYKIFVRLLNTCLTPFTQCNIKLYLFEHSDTLYKKIKAEII